MQKDCYFQFDLSWEEKFKKKMHFGDINFPLFSFFTCTETINVMQESLY